MMEALENGAEDVVPDEEYIEIFSEPDEFSNLREFIENQGYIIVEADIRQIATIKKELNDEEEEKMQRFLDKLDDCDDVQNVWHNADI